MLMPKKMKYRKSQRGKRRGMTKGGSQINFGSFGIKSIGRGWVTAREIEAARRAMTRHIKRGGEVWIRVFPSKPVTATSPETPMGSGKGSLDHFVAVVKPGVIMFEMDGISEDVAKEALRLASRKLSVKTKYVTSLES